MSKLDMERVSRALSVIYIHDLKPESKDIPMVHILEGISNTHRLMIEKSHRVKELNKKLSEAANEVELLSATLTGFEEVLNKVYSDHVIEEFLVSIEKEDKDKEITKESSPYRVRRQ